MKSAIGIDLGSRTTKIVKLANDKIVHTAVFDTGHNPLNRIDAELTKLNADVIVATGYGRNLLRQHGANQIVTEIKACARGAHYMYSACRTVIDIGGQDSKVMRVEPDGAFSDFEMNDRCAAGTGRFLEVMARALDYSIEEFGDQARQADQPVKINSICTVFAESEVVALITAGEKRQRIALGLHESIVERVLSMVSRIVPQEEILFVGGVAKNTCIYHLLQHHLKMEVYIPQNPQIVVALGAALEGMK
ncbi:3-hydroxyacyl-ACP dehydratase [candidate division KSB1 bacterium]|nr:3-hydroxyacyl-ACP dehydratase [candidate division KSB1 bacterium]